MTKRILTDLFLTDSAEPIEVEVPEFGCKFTLVPIRQSDRERWQKQFRMCPACGGVGFFPGDKRLLACHKCKGNPGPSLADRDIRFAVLKEVVQGWSGLVTDTGKEVPFSEGVLAKFSAEYEYFNILLNAAAALVKKVEQDEGEA